MCHPKRAVAVQTHPRKGLVTSAQHRSSVPISRLGSSADLEAPPPSRSWAREGVQRLLGTSSRYLPLGMMRSTDLCTVVLLVVAALALPVNMYQDTGYRVSRPW